MNYDYDLWIQSLYYSLFNSFFAAFFWIWNCKMTTNIYRALISEKGICQWIFGFAANKIYESSDSHKLETILSLS